MCLVKCMFFQCMGNNIRIEVICVDSEFFRLKVWKIMKDKVVIVVLSSVLWCWLGVFLVGVWCGDCGLMLGNRQNISMVMVIVSQVVIMLLVSMLNRLMFGQLVKCSSIERNIEFSVLKKNSGLCVIRVKWQMKRLKMIGVISSGWLLNNLYSISILMLIIIELVRNWWMMCRLIIGVRLSSSIGQMLKNELQFQFISLQMKNFRVLLLVMCRY